MYINKILEAQDTYNEIETCWEEIQARSFPARYSGYAYDGQKIQPGDVISKLSSGKYLKIN